jgi:prepilin-type N-terminal cleavage/methylation domain-containing protein
MRRTGFTLIEVLVVIAIIAILLAILLPSLGMAKSLGVQVREMAAAQQTMVAFQLYADDNEGGVLPGFPPSDWVTDGKIEVLNQMGEQVGAIEAQRYPWRLAPYVDYNFRGLYQDDDVLTEMEAKSQLDYEYWVSLFPSMGMNTTFVGGDANQLGWNPQALQAFGKFYVTRMDEACHPTRLMAFASARYYLNGDSTLYQGSFKIAPPHTAAGGWDEVYEEYTTKPGTNSGYVSLRHQEKAVTAQLDGHAETLGWNELRDMRRWANDATRADWVLGDD